MGLRRDEMCDFKLEYLEDRQILHVYWDYGGILLE